MKVLLRREDAIRETDVSVAAGEVIFPLLTTDGRFRGDVYRKTVERIAGLRVYQYSRTMEPVKADDCDHGDDE